jgi:hypothetical protein
MEVTQIIPMNSMEMYEAIDEFVHTVNVNTKYKTVNKKVRPAAIPLPADSFEKIKRASSEVIFQDPKRIGHTFTDSTRMKLQIGEEGYLLPNKEKEFREMLGKNGKAFGFDPSEIGCVDIELVEPMIIFTIPHVPWNLKPIPVSRAHVPKLNRAFEEKG